ncbi:MAG: N-acetylmuramoyl-L-alanine amidase [Romboutsia timonensis]
MIRKRFWYKRLIASLLLASVLVSGAISLKPFAKMETPRYTVSQECIVQEKIESKGKILLDLPHQDTNEDNGAYYGNVTERELAESISLKVKEILEKNGVEVILMREQGQSISIADRVYRANNLGDYDYYISLHINSCLTENTGTGVEGYSVGAWSLTNSILKELCNEFGYLNRGIYYSEYYNCNIKQKSTLLELGFINHEYDRDNLMNRQDDYARIIANGILENLNK